MESHYDTMLIPYEYSASFKAEIASGDGTSCKLTRLTLNGDK